MVFLLSAMILTNTMFLSLTHPLSMGLTLIFQTLIIAFFSSLVMPSFWFSYLLILIFLGGMLILFIYMSSLASNEQLNMTSSQAPSLLFASFLILFILFFSPQKAFFISDNFSNDLVFMWLFSSSYSYLASLLIIFLFFVLVAVIKITKFWVGTLRPIN